VASHLSFDLDGTLIRDGGDKTVWNEAIPQAYAQTHGVSEHEAKQTVYAAFYRARFIENIDDFTSIPYWVDRLDLADEAGGFIEQIADLATPYDDITSLHRLNEDHTLTLFTNSERELMEAKLKRMPFNNFYRTISAPTDYNSNKRNTAAWQQYINDINTSPDHIIHIGDRQLDDVTMPESVGITAYLLDRDGETEDALTSLSTLTDRLYQ